MAKVVLIIVCIILTSIAEERTTFTNMDLSHILKNGLQKERIEQLNYKKVSISSTFYAHILCQYFCIKNYKAEM